MNMNDTVSDTGTMIVKSSIEIEKERYEATSNGTFVVKASDNGDTINAKEVNYGGGESLGKIQLGLFPKKEKILKLSL